MRHLAYFQQLLGGNCLTSDIAEFTKEQRQRYYSTPLCVLLPSMVEQVQNIVRYCAKHKIGIVPQGGNTGLVAGSVSTSEQIILNLKKLSKIRQISSENNCIIVDAGCTLQQVKDIAEKSERSFPLGLSIDDKCQIGGNIASNAGGLNTLYYGSTREMTLGIEAILPNGEMLSSLHQVRKNNTGFDDKQLFIGTEGCFGVITGASLRLYPKPKKTYTQFVGCNSIEEVITLYHNMSERSLSSLIAFEVIGRFPLELVTKHRDFTDPFDNAYPYYVLLESLIDIPVKGSVSDKNLWPMRAEIPWVQRDEGGSIKHDISLPLNNLAAFMQEAEKAVLTLIPEARITPFGHIGDGNIHYNVMQPENMPKDEFMAHYDACNTIVHEIVLKYNGSISAEHGIGRAKKALFEASAIPSLLQLQRTLKQAIDPDNIMNPGII